MGAASKRRDLNLICVGGARESELDLVSQRNFSATDPTRSHFRLHSSHTHWLLKLHLLSLSLVLSSYLEDPSPFLYLFALRKVKGL
jgi:hypothetical protein